MTRVRAKKGSIRSTRKRKLGLAARVERKAMCTRFVSRNRLNWQSRRDDATVAVRRLSDADSRRRDIAAMRVAVGTLTTCHSGEMPHATACKENGVKPARRTSLRKPPGGNRHAVERDGAA